MLLPCTGGFGIQFASNISTSTAAGCSTPAGCNHSVCQINTACVPLGKGYRLSLFPLNTALLQQDSLIMRRPGIWKLPAKSTESAWCQSAWCWHGAVLLCLLVAACVWYVWSLCLGCCWKPCATSSKAPLLCCSGELACKLDLAEGT